MHQLRQRFPGVGKSGYSRKNWVIFGVLLLGNVFASAGYANGPAHTPEELGKRTAQALIAADTTSAELLLPSYEAYLPVCRVNLGESPPTDQNLHECYSRWMGRLREEIQRFPFEFQKATSFKADQIDGYDVTSNQQEGQASQSNVDIIFRVGGLKFKLTLQGCLQFNDAWYLIDFNWKGKEP